MKNNIFITTALAAAVLALPSCDDYLKVNSASNFTETEVFNTADEMEQALYCVYHYLTSKDTYGNAYMTTFCLNSDVEMETFSSDTRSALGTDYRCFDATPDGSHLTNTWTAAYATIEYANNFVTAAEASDLYTQGDEDVLQMIGEAKCIRAMNYYDLVMLWGDVPFRFERAMDVADEMVMPIADRNDILDAIIADLESAAQNMKFAEEVTVERCSKEYAWALIARIALARGGYSLRHNGSISYEMQRATDYKDYYKKAMAYCDSVISSGKHDLVKPYRQVFIDECNFIVDNADDPIFEIPFAVGLSGYVGYSHGPSSSYDDANYGKTGGSLQLNAFYRWTFDSTDVRRDYVIGLWDYAEGSYKTTDGKNVENTVYATSFKPYGLLTRCNKWSKLWTNAPGYGESSTSSDGINFPYMRYADVLLMYAEAANEVNEGPTSEAYGAINKVRTRAGLPSCTASTKDDFFEAIVDERAWEFGGESMRWKDLVRWNRYSEVVFRQFYNYFEFAKEVGTGSDENNINNFCTFSASSDDIDETSSFKKIKYGCDLMSGFTYLLMKYEDNPGDAYVYPCTNSKYMYVDILNLYPKTKANIIEEKDTANYVKFTKYITTDITSAWTGESSIKDGCRYSFRGYIYANESDKVSLTATDVNSLPAVRYILPISQTYISRSNGAYQNYYGY
ncbi:MAG: RagB/SusD family nutrient uptake outer membrane protein [Marinilabiliaceae bacterium]|nr:RagB/SusD family nutrient uptake outer membrane protein [Marinilabiliaceae bacterium]